jgi:hypothetical protein
MADEKQRPPDAGGPQTVSRQKVDDRLKAAAETAGDKPPREARHEVEGSPVRRPEDVQPVDEEAGQGAKDASDLAARKATTPNRPE